MTVFTASGTENLMRWDRRSAGFMEVWYATISHRATGAGVWLRYTITAPTASDPYCELWGVVFDRDGKFDFAGKERFAIDRLAPPSGRDDGAIVRIGNAWLSETHLEGRLTRNGHHLEWSLDLEPAPRCFHHLPGGIGRIAERRVSTLCSPNLAVPFTGSVVVDGHPLTFEGDRGTQSHRWGRRHAPSWVWCHCSSFEDGDAVFEGLAATTRVAFLRPTTTFVFLHYDGEDIAFNELGWALRAKSRYDMPTWAFTARTDVWKIAGAARVAESDLIQLRYEDPDGSSRFCANAEVADLALEVYRRDGAAWRHHGSLTSRGAAHLEFGRSEPFAELPVAF
ncbi:MAG TPA: hypothetical protein VFK89_09355 [Actinomycetota bacterium]|nr:hypothetical protein [Actinomycetota bacterium]